MQVSLLLGCGYDAYVVGGYAPIDIVQNDQSSQRCPMLEAEEAAGAAQEDSGNSSNAKGGAKTAAPKYEYAATSGDTTFMHFDLSWPLGCGQRTEIWTVIPMFLACICPFAGWLLCHLHHCGGDGKKLNHAIGMVCMREFFGASAKVYFTVASAVM